MTGERLCERLLRFLEDETRRIAGDPHFEIEASNRRKQRFLQEVSGSYRADFTASEAEALRAALERNGKAIALQLEVARRMNVIVQKARREVRSDGCYDECAW